MYFSKQLIFTLYCALSYHHLKVLFLLSLFPLLKEVYKMQRGDSAMKDLIAELQAMEAPYTVDKFISSGSYGAVCAGLDVLSQTPVAIKRVFSTVSDGRQVNILSDAFLAKRVLREVKLLCHFDHPNILGLRDVLLFDTIPQQLAEGIKEPTKKPKLYLVTELMRTDLSQVISDSRMSITAEHIRYFMYHTLLGLIRCQRPVL